MKRTLVIVTVLLTTFAAAGCRAREDRATPADRPAAVVSPTPAAGLAPQVASSKVAVNLSEVDGMLAELEKQLTEADKTPDADE
ncbi:hypothetical protein [Rhizocola hellebori]|nr:hypothetical protein [Rhizocola hellebori]